MKFKRFYLMNELFSNWDYWTPKDKEHMLFDFYALSLVYPERLDDINMKIAFKQAQEEIVKALVEDFKFAVFYALASEFRHVGGMEASEFNQYEEQREDYFKFFRKIGQLKFATKYAKIMRRTKWSREDSASALIKMNLPETKLASIMSKSFVGDIFKPIIPDRYGGKPWAMIADAWGRLYTTKGTKNQMVLIDHIYDLQHNNDTVFDKVKTYYKKGKGKYANLDWLKNALDFKRDIRDPFALFDKISPGLQDPYAYVMKMQSGITLQKYKEENRPIGKGDKVKVRHDLQIGQKYGDVKFTKTYHAKYIGKWLTIHQVYNKGKKNEFYIPKEDKDNSRWTRDMFDMGAK